MLRHFTGSLAKNSRAGIALDGPNAGIARVHRQNGGAPSLAIRLFDADGDWFDAAAEHADDLGLQRIPASSVLSAKSYQLQLLEIPNVPREELLSAIRWRLKDLIDFPVEEAVVELLEMPPHSNPGAPHTGYAVVTRRDEVMQQIETMQRADLTMDVIDIPELCVRNVAVMLPEDKDGVAFLHFTEDCGYLTITRQGVLHLTRHLDAGRRALADAKSDEFTMQELVNGIALEVQRSLDYYESHYDCRPVTQIVLGPGADLEELTSGLTQNLGVNVRTVEFEDLFSLEQDIPLDVQGNCLLAVGAALRPSADPKNGVAI
jgi:MSHA biogenesis protein MshI